MIYTNALSIFIPHHQINRPSNKNIRSIQEIMRAREPAVKKYKKVCEDLRNLMILTKSATPGKVQSTFVHVTIGNNSLGESVVALSLAGYLSSPYFISIKMVITFAADSDNIHLPIAEVLLCTAAGDLARSKKQRDWTPHNAVILSPFLTEAAILHGELDAGELLKIFARSITEWAKEEETVSKEDDKKDEDSKGGVETEEEKTTKKGKVKQATTERLTTIADDCDDVLAFL